MPKTSIKTVKTLHVRLYAPEAEVVEKMIKAGYPPNDRIRNFLLEFGKENFSEDPLYAKAAMKRAENAEKAIKDKNMPNEEYAERVLRARVIKGKAWIMDGGGYPKGIDLSLVKKVDLSHPDIIEFHNTLDGIPYSPEGQSYTLSKERLQKKKQEWEKMLEMI